MRRLRGWMIGSRLLYFVALLTTSMACVGQSPGSAGQQQALEDRIERISANLQAAQSQVEALRLEMEALRRDLNAAKSVTPPAEDARPVATDVAKDEELNRLKEDQDVLSSQVKQHEQTKVESDAKFPVKITGLVLFNAFVNQGVVDEVDLPTSALRRSADVSHGSVGGSMQQTWLGLEGIGPVIGRVHTSARVSLDFFGGTTGGVTYGPAGIVRLRTAAVRGETTSDLVEARFDEPLISPLSPTSFASVAQPALSWTGNLWTWAPELRWKHSFAAGSGRSVETEIGLRDPYLAGTQVYQGTRVASPAELSRRPAYEGRVSYGSAVNLNARPGGYGDSAGTGWRVGVGGYYAGQNYGSGILIRTWAVTGDWSIPLRPWLHLSGELYRGTGLGGLGGGAYRDVVQGIDRVSGANRTIGLDAAGGWAQVQAVATPRLQLNAAFGQDAGSGSQLRLLILPAPNNPLGFYARNRAITGNVIYRPWSSVLISPEYRRLISWPISGAPNWANVFTLSAGYQF